jgi:hypothetical protein
VQAERVNFIADFGVGTARKGDQHNKCAIGARKIGQPVTISLTTKLAAVVILTICFARPAIADDVKTLGAGANDTCGKWLADRQSGSANAFTIANWALRYLSGAATYSETLNPLEGLDSDAVLYWIDNYCRSHPLEKFTVALKTFAREHPR